VDQKEVFEAVGLDILAKAWSGYHACLFAYGQTGSGKTYSIMGCEATPNAATATSLRLRRKSHLLLLLFLLPRSHIKLKISASHPCFVIHRYGEDKGVIPRICDALFFFIAHQSTKAGAAQFKVDASYLEVYNETITDLLCPPPKEVDFVPLKPKERIKLEAKLKKLQKEAPKELADKAKREQQIAQLGALLDPQEAARQATSELPRIREDPDKGVVVDNLKHFAVATFADCDKLLEEGLANRTVGSTAMNASSSRSALVYRLVYTAV
jgi:Skp family chaperone for outer membrane proteins